MSVDVRGAAAAGMLDGILGGWKRDANPGALDDMVEAPGLTEGPCTWTSLTFADGATFVLSCECVAEATSEGGDDE